jgi:hypothetical protein
LSKGLMVLKILALLLDKMCTFYEMTLCRS